MVDLDKLSTADLLEIGLDCSVPDTIDLLVDLSAKQAEITRAVVSELPVVGSVTVFWNPVLEKVGLFTGLPDESDNFTLYKQALEDTGLVVASHPLLQGHLQDWWVKIAESPTIRAVGEALQFLPSKYVPGFGGRPLASTVASGLLGAGLGYGGGWLAEQLMPDSVKEKGVFSRNMAIAGGLGGAAVGAVPGFVNLATGKPFNQRSMFAGAEPSTVLTDTSTNAGPWADYNLGKTAELSDTYLSAVADFAKSRVVHADPELVKEAFGSLAESNTELIRTDELGRVLWGSQANPTTTVMTTGVMHGASQMYDPRALPGTVTPHQTGLLGLAMGAAGGGIKGYLVGYGAGKTLAMLTGLPPDMQEKITNTGLALGVLESVVPKFFQ
jgi:hypothetical protein